MVIFVSTAAAIGILASAPMASGTPFTRDVSPLVVTTGKVNAATGSVRVDLQTRDGHRTAFRIPTSTAKGTITRLPAAGTSSATSFVYRPTAPARHAAARVGATSADKRDTFAVTISDGYGGTMSVPISLRVSPQNAVPVAEPVMQPVGADGVVSGNVGARDPDGDSLTYAITTPPSHGNAVVTANGDFTYTPNARASRRSMTADPGADSLVITVTDGYGGAATIPITCPAHG